MKSPLGHDIFGGQLCKSSWADISSMFLNKCHFEDGFSNGRDYFIYKFHSISDAECDLRR